MNYEIIRGNNQIGGTITKISSDDGTNIIIDFGAELSVRPEDSTDPYVIEKVKECQPYAIFFTHIHGDHIGLLHAIPDCVKEIYIGPMALELLINIRKTLLKIKNIAEKDKLQRELDILESNRIRTYEDGQSCIIGKDGEHEGIVFTPFIVDHSVADAYMIRFEADGKCIVHTGDYRNHGRLGEKLIDTVKERIADKKIDVLITEGTMMTRTGERVLSEIEMQAEATSIIEKNKYVFLVCSSTNMESLATFYQANIEAAKRRGISEGNSNKYHPPFMCNSYVKAQLDVFSQYAEKQGRNELKFPYSYSIINKLNYIIPELNITQKQHMRNQGFVMMIGTSNYYKGLMKEFEDLNPLVIYSMWDGYLVEGKEYSSPELIELKKECKGRFKSLHTSGHATVKTIEEVINIIHPVEALVPIHTENPSGFLMLDIDDEIKKKIDFGFELPEKFAPKSDTRAFEENDKIMKALKPGGSLHAFIQLLQMEEFQLLQMCFRGNSGQTCTIYYNNNEFFKISIVSGLPRLSFNRNHARYWDRNSKYAQEAIKKLKKYDISEKIEKDGRIGCFINSGRSYRLEELIEISRIRMNMMESYFSTDNLVDFYQDNKIVSPENKEHIEKKEQQQLMIHNVSMKNGYYLYDMEYAQPFVNEKIKENYKRLVGATNQNKPDSLAIRYNSDGIPEALVFVELKSTKAAMKGSSGIFKHMQGMYTYVKNPINKEFLMNRKKEARGIIEDYMTLGIHTAPNMHLDDIGVFENLKEELLVVITDNTDNCEDSAKAYYIEHKEEIDRIAEDCNCEIMLLPKNTFTLDRKYIV